MNVQEIMDGYYDGMITAQEAIAFLYRLGLVAAIDNNKDLTID